MEISKETLANNYGFSVFIAKLLSYLFTIY